MNEMTPEVMERLAPAIVQWISSGRFPGVELGDCYCQHLIFEDRSHRIDVWAHTPRGSVLIMQLDPAERGLALCGDELVTLEDPGVSFAPLDQERIDSADLIHEVSKFLHDGQ